MFTSKCSEDDLKAIWCNSDLTWEALDQKIQALLPGMEPYPVYFMSKAACHAYTMIAAKQYPNIKQSAITPGLVDTAIATDIPESFGTKITPEQGTIAIRHCLFNELKGNGWFYGSDGVRGPLHKSRAPGEPEYQGSPEYNGF